VDGEATEQILGVVFRVLYPITLNQFDVIRLNSDLPKSLESPHDVLALLRPLITALETKLDAAEAFTSGR
jgi:hypothetical protein